MKIIIQIYEGSTTCPNDPSIYNKYVFRAKNKGIGAWIGLGYPIPLAHASTRKKRGRS